MRDRRVLFFGDSLVAGVGDPSGHGWVGRVAAAAFDAGTPVTAYNLGVRGETSPQVASRWRQETVPRLSPAAETCIVVSFGANDTTIEDGRRRIEADRSCRALAEVLDGAATIGLRVSVVGPAPVDDGGQNERIISLSASFAGVCAERSTPFVSVIEALLASPVWMEEVAAGDGAHPGAAGYDALAEQVLKRGWLEWLCGPSRALGARRPER
jgi:lysophospholipase L1-like esterase